MRNGEMPLFEELTEEAAKGCGLKIIKSEWAPLGRERFYLLASMAYSFRSDIVVYRKKGRGFILMDITWWGEIFLHDTSSNCGKSLRDILDTLGSHSKILCVGYGNDATDFLEDSEKLETGSVSGLLNVLSGKEPGSLTEECSLRGVIEKNTGEHARFADVFLIASLLENILLSNGFFLFCHEAFKIGKGSEKGAEREKKEWTEEDMNRASVRYERSIGYQ